MAQYPETSNNPNFPQIEAEIQAFWERERVFYKSIEDRGLSIEYGAGGQQADPALSSAKPSGSSASKQASREQSKSFTFYDGPPFANGLPHYGHLLTSCVKDIFGRYQTMKGKVVERRFGWDCHGLPAEMEAEKQIGIQGQLAIQEYGIEKFNQFCRNSVMHYAQDWQFYVNRMGRWVDWNNQYRTMDTSYMESVMWAFKQLHDKGLIYEGHKVMPYSWACETPLSNFETRMDNAYREKISPAVTVKFKLKQKPQGAPEADAYYMLAWTTTPWTLPSNLALAVGMDVEYACVVREGECIILGNFALNSYAKELGEGAASVKDATVASARLYARPFTEADFEMFRELENDPEIVSRMAAGAMDEATLKAEFSRYIADHKKRGYSQWAVFEKETNAFIGRAGFDIRDWNQHDQTGKEVIELRYALKGQYSGKGYATEISRALLGWASSATTAEIINAGTFDNEASKRVLSKLGFTYERDVAHRDKQIGYYTIDFTAWRQRSVLRGSDLIGISYEPLFPYFANDARGGKKAFTVLAGDFVTEGDGTGIVHMAPGFGEDDQRVCMENGICTHEVGGIICPVDHAGKFTHEIFDLGQEAELVSPASPERAESAAPSEGKEARRGALETERLTARPFTTADADLLWSLNGNPQVAATTYDGEMSREESDAHLKEFIAHQEKYGMSQWAVFEKSSGKFVGRAGLTFRQMDKTRDPQWEIRCALLPDYWKQGYGREILAAFVERGFAQFNVPMIVAAAQPTNPRSHAMIESIGFKKEKDIPVRGGTGPYFVRMRADVSFGKEAGLVNPASPERAEAPLHLRASKPEGEQKTLSLKGLQVFEANEPIMQWLKAEGKLFKKDQILHNYPHCWRTDTPLIYKAVPSWYVQVTKFKDRMVELNQQINWIPGHVKDGLFGKWLENAHDWAISRNRFWGAPIPVWKTESGKMKVFGSIAELEAFFDVKVDDLHRPFIDTLTKTENGETWKRVPEVLDCWFESGSMPFAQLHYPFENKEKFFTQFPADFIVEYTAQTRGWFYTLMVLSTALFDSIPFKNCICHGVILGEPAKDPSTGKMVRQKLSKRLKNYADPTWVYENYGADAMRWMMVSSPVMVGGELQVSKEGDDIRDQVRLIIKPIWNAYHFFTLYANADNVKAYDLLALHDDEDSATGGICCGGAHGVSDHPIATDVMDRYILAKLKQAVNAIETALDNYTTPDACRAVEDFFEVLNNWYIRRSRERFWKESADTDKMSAYNTLYTCLISMCKAAAPLLPFTLEAVYRGLVGADASVHLTHFPDVAHIPAEAELLTHMDKVREICTAGLSIRSTENIRTRQPLSACTVYGEKLDGLSAFTGIIADELNVKQVNVNTAIASVADYKLQVNFPVAGKRLGKAMGAVTAASKKGEWKLLDDGRVNLAGETLELEEFSLSLVAKNPAGTQPLPKNDALVVLDLHLTDALKQEGIARDVVRLVQQARKDANLHVSDKIVLHISTDGPVRKAVEENAEYIREQTLTQQLHLEKKSPENMAFSRDEQIEGSAISIALSKAA